MNADGGGPTRVSQDVGAHDSHPIWSPNDSRIVFKSVRNGNPTDLYVMHTDAPSRRVWPGYHGLVGVSFAPSSFPLGIRIDERYHRLKQDAAVGNRTNQILMGTGNLIYKFKTAEDSKFRPYLIAGPAFMISSWWAATTWLVRRWQHR